MLRWLRRFFAPPALSHPLSGFTFKSNEAFFEYQCRFGDTTPRYGHVCYAIVVGDHTAIAREAGIATADNLIRVLGIRLAAPDNGRAMLVDHDMRRGIVHPGDLVAFLPLEHHPAIGWQGALIAKCAPAFNDSGVEVLQRF
ncbi:MAG: hypothetical protein K2W91_04655 [Novosphingobium sp.]|nr:hypothetical protein [Novosphingobium sp.]